MQAIGMQYIGKRSQFLAEVHELPLPDTKRKRVHAAWRVDYVPANPPAKQSCRSRHRTHPVSRHSLPNPIAQNNDQKITQNNSQSHMEVISLG